MKAVKAKMLSLMPSSMKNYGESAVTLRNEVELRMKMNSMSWYDRAKGRRKFRVNEEDLGHIQFQELLKKENDSNEVLIEEEEAEDTLQAMDSVRRHSFVGYVNRMKERFEVKAETHERRESRSASTDRDQRGRTFTSSVAARIQETTKALQGSVREEASTRKEQVFSHKTRILRDINENTSSLKAAWNRNIRGTLRVNNNRQRLLDDVKIKAPNSLQPPPRNIFCVAEFSYEAHQMDELCLTRGDIIRPMFMIEAGWWAGMMVLPLDQEKQDVIGIFPANYVKCIQQRRTGSPIASAQ